MTTIAVITSRWHSTRLPGKALLDICGKPMLRHVVDNVRKAKLVDEVVVATTPTSFPIARYCAGHQINYYVGDEEDILDRLYQAAIVYEADRIVRVWGDSPLIRGEDIDALLQMNGADRYLTLTTPSGVIAAIPYLDLKRAWHNIKDKDTRLWIHKQMSVPILTVDTQEDLERIREIVANQANNRLPVVG